MDLALNILDPTSIIATAGIALILVILFAETGLLVGFFLPGDTLLFSAGLFATVEGARSLPDGRPISLTVLMCTAPLAAILGAQFGHFLGARYGRKLFERADSRLFRKEHVEKAEFYFNKFRPEVAVVLARFIPVVRTFMNPLAGILHMSARRFFFWNIIGAIMWTETIILVGYFLGQKIHGIDKFVLPIVAFAVLASIVPVVREVMKSRGDSAKKNDSDASRPSLSGDSSR